MKKKRNPAGGTIKYASLDILPDSPKVKTSKVPNIPVTSKNMGRELYDSLMNEKKGNTKVKE